MSTRRNVDMIKTFLKSTNRMEAEREFLKKRSSPKLGERLQEAFLEYWL